MKLYAEQAGALGSDSDAFEDEESEEENGVVDTEQRVDEAMLCLTMDTADVISTGLPTDRREEELISEFMTSGCWCTKERVRNAANSLVWSMSDC